jgi:LuxR family maltose regulon positive regulatory protein
LIEHLTEREAGSAPIVVFGLSNQKSRRRLYLSAGTVKTHTHNLYSKLGVQSRTQAIARAKELSLLS